MNGPLQPWIVGVLGTLAGYLIGAIPFGYLIYRWARGADIRTVGSGNIGATNVGRLMGFRWFVIVFLLDVLKGWLPTFGIPWLLTVSGVAVPSVLPVLIALAAVVGHNFPVYLGFKGGKGVATSLGSLLALDPVACGAAAIGFFVCFVIFRYVSLSSIVGAISFTACYFTKTSHPWGQEHLAMSLLAVAVSALLIVRHRKNLQRIAAGAEPKVPLRRSRKNTDDSSQPKGFVKPSVLFAIAGLGAVIGGAGYKVMQIANTPIEANAGPWALKEVHRELTGQQRSTRVTFAAHGRKLAVMCPRYNKVLLYDVTDAPALELSAEIALEGRPLAMAAKDDLLMILQRPSGDDKHREPGWWETFHLDGRKLGPRHLAGFYPDDLTMTPDGKFLLVLSSGRAEGDDDKHLPRLDLFETPTTESASEFDPRQPVASLALEPGEDLERIFVSASGAHGLITLNASNRGVAIDLRQPASPQVLARLPLQEAGEPYLSKSEDGDFIIMPTRRESEAVIIPHPGREADRAAGVSSEGYLVYTVPDDSVLEVAQTTPRGKVGRFELKGPFNLGTTRPSGLAFCPDRNLIAVATKPGTVHLIAIESRLDDAARADRVTAHVSRPQNFRQPEFLATASEYR